MHTSGLPFDRLVLVATSFPAEALVLRTVIERVRGHAALAEDEVSAMHALCGHPHRFAALVAGERVGRVSGLTLCGLARDAGYTGPALLFATEAARPVAARAAKLRVSVLWHPVSQRRLEDTLRELLPSRLCAVG